MLYSKSFPVAVLLGSAILVIAVSNLVFKPNKPPEEVKADISEPLGPSVLIENVRIPVEVASSTLELTRGLSGRASLEAGSGMLFVFSKPDKYRFWMPNMKFPIDIVWIQNGKVVGVTPDVPNVFNPENPKIYQPPVPVQYVLEVNSGFSEKNGVTVGDSVTLRL